MKLELGVQQEPIPQVIGRAYSNLVIAHQALRVFNAVGKSDNKQEVRDVVVIPDSYTNLMPLAALLDASSQEFLGDRFRFRIMPSLLTMGILNQFPPKSTSLRTATTSPWSGTPPSPLSIIAGNCGTWGSSPCNKGGGMGGTHSQMLPDPPPKISSS